MPLKKKVQKIYAIIMIIKVCRSQRASCPANTESALQAVRLHFAWFCHHDFSSRPGYYHHSFNL